MISTQLERLLHGRITVNRLRATTAITATFHGCSLPASNAKTAVLTAIAGTTIVVIVAVAGAFRSYPRFTCLAAARILVSRILDGFDVG